MNKSRLLGALCACVFLFSFTESVMAGDLSITINDNLNQILSGDTADRNASKQISTLAADSNFLRNGSDSASFGYLITGQVSADDGTGGANDAARLEGDVSFDFSLPTALWDISAEIIFRGVQDTDGSAASASAGVLALSSTGSAGALSPLTLSAGSSTFFDESGTRSLNDSTSLGHGTISVSLDMQATSNDVFILTGDEAFVGLGEFSGLDSFSTDNDLHAINSLIDDGAYVTLTFTPNLNLSGQTLSGDVALESGEVLSGRGGVSGQVSGAVGSSITANSTGLTLGSSFSASGFDYAGTLNVGNSTVNLLDSNEAILKGSTTLSGGTLNASNGIALSSDALLSGNGEVAAALSGVAGSTITANSTGLTLGDSSSSTGFEFDGTLNVGSTTVTLLDATEANLGNSTTLGGGILKASNGFSIDGSDTISGFGIIFGDVLGSNAPGGLLIASPTGSVSLTGPLSINFETATIYSQLAAELGSSTNLSSGTLVASNGVALGNNSVLSGNGVVDAALTATAGSLITSSGDLQIGVLVSSTGVSTEGSIQVNSATLTLLDADAVELGSSTTLSGGTLIARNGLSIDGTDTISGFGLIRGAISGTNAASGLVATGTFAPATPLNVGSDDLTILSDTVVNLADTSLSGGSLRAAAGMIVTQSNTIAGYGTLIGDVDGRSQSVITATGGNLSLGDVTSFNGFRTLGEINTGNNTVTLNSATFATLGTVTTVNGGVLDAVNGVFLGGGKVITGSGSVDSRVSAEAGSLIAASGDLNLGDASAFDGYFSRGNLEVNSHTVTLHDANEAKLGSLTIIGDSSGGGTLSAENGVVLNGGHSIAGYGLVTADIENQGAVIGQGTQPSDALELSGSVSGIGDYEGNIIFSGTFSPGNSPAEVSLENITLGGILEIEIGGLIAGEEYDWLNVSGTANLGGTLDVSLIDLGGGLFTPGLGDSFDILTATSIEGEFDLLTLAVLGNGLDWDVSYIVDDFGIDFVKLNVVNAVPIPPSVWLFGSGLLGLVGISRRRKA